MANVSKLLNGSPDKDDLLVKLEPTTLEWARLNAARDKIRGHLKGTFALLGRRLGGTAFEPRFFTQGSAKYRTLNRPARAKQHMDMDDGTYLRMSALQNAPKPSIAAAAFFEVVDTSLQALAEKEGWKFDKKPTCARLVIGPDAHVDVPLYAIPDVQYETLAKAAAQRSAVFAEAFDFMAADSADDWKLLPSEKVLLAHREEDWKVSDPRKIHRWFLGAVALHGEQLRRQCRYLKAWRDLHPQLDCVKSILLMACVWQVYQETGRGLMPNRDDLALAKIVHRLPGLLAGPVYNETEGGAPQDRERLDRFTEQERRQAIEFAKELDGLVNGTINNCHHVDLAVDNMRKTFGGRIPLRPDLVVIETAAREVMAKAPTIIPAAPSVGRSISG